MHYVSEFGGGLGDIILNCHDDRRYMSFCNLPKNESATIFIQSVNPFAHELFENCPSKDQLEVITTGWFWSEDPEELKSLRVLHGMPREASLYTGPGLPGKEIRWYPSKLDDELIADIDEQGPFIVIEPSAGDYVRTLPEGFLEAIADTILNSKYIPVLIGRSYDRSSRSVRRAPGTKGLVDVIDRLSVPGTLQLLRLSRGVVCTHSAVHHAASKDGKPNFCLYPQEMEVLPGYAYQRCINAARDCDKGHWWGITQPCTTSATFENFTADKLNKWLASL